MHGAGSQHSCPVCKTGFANKRNLKNHVTKQHPGVPFLETHPGGTFHTTESESEPKLPRNDLATAAASTSHAVATTSTDTGKGSVLAGTPKPDSSDYNETIVFLSDIAANIGTEPQPPVDTL